MSSIGNMLKNNNLAALERQATPVVVGAIKKASAHTGVDFAYLMEKASAESSFRTDVKSRTSSATGLYQFIEKTWLGMVRDHGAEYGLGDYADKISANGKVTDAKTRKEILELRKDPEVAAAMAAEYAADNKAYLESRVDSEIGPVEMYLAHFMGPSGAAGFIQAMEKNPMENAADIFPAAARANYNVFHDSKTGKQRTLAGVYDFFAQKFENSTNGVTSDTMIASRSYSDDDRMAGSRPTRMAAADTSSSALKSNSYETDLLWAQEIFRNNQAQQLRILAGNDSNDNGIRRNNERFAHLNTRQGSAASTQALVNNPVELMQLAQLDAHSTVGRYNQ